MRIVGWISVAVLAVLSTAAMAQDKTKDGESATAPTAKQSAPRNSPEASGHDVQTGKPKTGERPAGENQNKDKPEEKTDDAKQSK